MADVIRSTSPSRCGCPLHLIIPAIPHILKIDILSFAETKCETLCHSPWAALFGRSLSMADSVHAEMNDQRPIALRLIRIGTIGTRKRPRTLWVAAITTVQVAIIVRYAVASIRKSD